MAKSDESSKAILLHSGGLDSTILGYFLNEKGVNYQSLFINYDQTPREAELAAVRNTSALLKTHLDVIEISGLRSAFTSSKDSLMLAVGNPGRHVLELGSAILLSTALVYARRLCINTVYIGYTKLDADYSKEYTQEFLDSFSELSSQAGYPRISFIAPFVNKSKAEVLRIGSMIPEVLASTWTCHLDGPLQCGFCESCQGRREAFHNAKVSDSTQYQN